VITADWLMAVKSSRGLRFPWKQTWWPGYTSPQKILGHRRDRAWRLLFWLLPPTRTNAVGIHRSDPASGGL